MSNTTVKHCDSCGQRMERDYAKLTMPADVRVSPNILPTPRAFQHLPLMPVTSNGEPPMMVVHRVYDLCEACAGLLVVDFIHTGEKVKADIDEQRRREAFARMEAQLAPLDPRD